MYILLDLRLGAKTPVYDHAGAVLCYADRDKVRSLIERSDIEAIGTRKRIRALRFRLPDSTEPAGARGKQLAEPHTCESYWNVRGVWHIDRIPDTLAPLFSSVTRSVRAA